MNSKPNRNHKDDRPFEGLDLRVLVVEDDAAMRDVLARHLRSMGLLVEQAGDGREALDIFQSVLCDLVLSDVRMPGMDGMELLQEVKSRNPLTPVVLISGYEEARMIVRALKMGAEDFLAKPFNRERLLRSLEQALTTRLPVRLGRDGCCSVHQVTEIVIPSRPEFIRLLINQMCLSAEQAGYVEDQLDNSLRLALVEALTNAMEHGNKWDPEKTVRVKASFSRGEMKVTISDQGRGFSWHSLPDPTRGVNLTAERGRGVFLMRTIVDEVKFNQPGNQVTLVSRKKCNPGQGL